MPKKPRKESLTQIYHFITRGVNKMQIFHQKQDYTDEVLSKELRGEGFRIAVLDGMDLIVREMNYDIHARIAWLIDLPNVIAPSLIKKKLYRSLYAMVVQ